MTKCLSDRTLPTQEHDKMYGISQQHLRCQETEISLTKMATMQECVIRKKKHMSRVGQTGVRTYRKGYMK